MKYASAEFAITKSEFEKIERRIEAFREVIGAERTIQLTLVTVKGLKPNVYRNDVQAEIVLDDLFAP